jgi:hypothetical protein
MHIEAMNWSGLGLAEYAAALGLSPHDRIMAEIISYAIAGHHAGLG